MIIKEALDVVKGHMAFFKQSKEPEHVFVYNVYKTIFDHIEKLEKENARLKIKNICETGSE